MTPRRIAIVGGGATGLAVVHALDALVAAAPVDRELQVVLIERSGSVGPGLAYGTSDAGHLINMPAGTMGFAGAGDFQRWRDGAGDAGGAEPDAAAPSRYPPRSLYGRYLASIAGDLLQRRARGLSLQVIRDEVTAIEPSDGAVTLALRQRAPVRVQSAVLAIGALPPTTYAHLVGCPGYIGSPWPSDVLRAIPPGADVAILGSSLTAIDAVRSLIGHGHTGRITLVSRHGYLPKVQGDTARYAGAVQLRRRLAALLGGGDVRWRSVLRILSEEIGRVDPGGGWSLHEPPGDPLAALRRDIEAAQDGQTVWQEVLVATAGIIENLWNAMAIAERRRFDRDLSAAWAANRHPMPLPNALFLEQALASGQLRVLGGADVRVEPRRSGARFRLDGTDRPATSRWLVNCTGAGRDVTQARSALLRGLLASGQIAAHPCGGVAVDFASFRPVDGPGRRSPGLFVVGPLTRGVHFYTHAIERHVEHARRVAAQLLEAPAAGHDRPAAAPADASVVPA